MSALIGLTFGWVGVARLVEWAFFDHDRDDLSTGLFFLTLAAIAFLIHGVSA